MYLFFFFCTTISISGFLLPPVITNYPFQKLAFGGINYYDVNKTVTVSCLNSGKTSANITLLSLSPENTWISLPVTKKGKEVEAKIQVTRMFQHKCCVENDAGELKCSESRISTAPSFFVDRPTEPGIPLDKANVTEGETLRFTCWAPPDPQIQLVFSHRFSSKAIADAEKYSNESGHYMIANSFVRGAVENKFTCEIHVNNHYVMQKTERIRAKWLSKAPLPMEAGFMNVSDSDYEDDEATTPVTPLPFNTAKIVFVGMAVIVTVGAVMAIVKIRSTIVHKNDDRATSTRYVHVKQEELGEKNEENQLGKGQFGCVYKGKWSVNGTTRQVAYKVFSTEHFTKTEDGLMELRRELDKLKRIPYHPHIITLLAATTRGRGVVTIVMELCDSKSLRDYVKDKRNEFSQLCEPQETLMKVELVKEFVCYATQICRGMEHLHTGINGKTCLHMDLAARNVLKKCGIVMISDFGMAHLGSDDEGYYPLKPGTRRPLEYYAPECLGSSTDEKHMHEYNEKSRFSKASDVWSFGVLLHEIFSFGVSPRISYEARCVGIYDILGFLEKGFRLEKPSLCPDIVFDIVKNQCWRFSSKDRPEFSDLNTQFTELLRTEYYNKQEMEIFERNVADRNKEQEDWRRIVREADNERPFVSSWNWLACCQSTTVQEENMGYSREENEEMQPLELTETEPFCIQQQEADENSS